MIESAIQKGIVMPDERFVVMTVECEHCKTKQAVHVAAKPGFAQMGDQSVSCINCKEGFAVMVPDRIIGGPFAMK